MFKAYYDDVTILADGTRVYSVHVNGRAPLSGGGANGVPLGRCVGRVWRQEPYGWVAAPLAHPDDQPDSWSAEVDRSVRHFGSRAQAAVFLYGYDQGTRRDGARAALAALPWRKSADGGA